MNLQDLQRTAEKINSILEEDAVFKIKVSTNEKNLKKDIVLAARFLSVADDLDKETQSTLWKLKCGPYWERAICQGKIPSDASKEAKEQQKMNKQGHLRARKDKKLRIQKNLKTDTGRGSDGTSSFGVAVDLFCKYPTITKEELSKKTKAKFADAKDSSIATAYSQCLKIYTLLKKNGHI